MIDKIIINKILEIQDLKIHANNISLDYANTLNKEYKIQSMTTGINLSLHNESDQIIKDYNIFIKDVSQKTDELMEMIENE